MPRLEISLLSGFQARLDTGQTLSFPTRKVQALLGFLASAPGREQSRDKLAMLLWGSTQEDQARNSLRQALFALRRALAAVSPDPLVVTAKTVALNPGAADIDVRAFETAAAKDSESDLERAMELYRGDFLDGFGAVREAAFEEWLLGEQGRLHDIAVRAVERLLRLQLGTAGAERSITTARRLLALDPVHEDVHRTVMRLYIRQGRWGAALRQYELCRGLVRRHLNVEPEAETRQLYQEIVAGRGAVTPARDEPAPPRREPARRAAAVTAPPVRDLTLVGRRRETERLREIVDATWRGQGQAVAVVGSVGMGKTRLVEHLATSVLERGGRVLVARAWPAEQTTPLRPWVDALTAGHVLRDPDVVARLNPVWRAELSRLFPELRTPTEPARGDEAHPRLLEAVSHVTQLLATTSPLVLVLEDAHGADDLSRRLLTYIGHRLRAARVLVVATLRGETDDDAVRHFLKELGRLPRFTRLELAPFSRDETRELVRRLAGDERPARGVARLADRLWRATSGTPINIVEAVRAVREGRGTSDGGAARDLLELIHRRLDRLGRRERRLVDAAAVVAREFDLPFLARVAGLDDTETAAGITELIRTDVLHGVERGFGFTHERLRDVAYASAAADERSDLHRRAAAALETLAPGDAGSLDASLATHHAGAGQWEPALAHWRRAGAHAYLFGVHQDAATAFEHALEALRHTPDDTARLEQEIDLRVDLRHALLPLAQPERIDAVLAEAMSLAHRLGDAGRLGRIQALTGYQHWWNGAHEQALEALGAAATAARTLRDPVLGTSAMYYEGLVRHALGDYRGAVRLLRQTRAAVEGGLTTRRFGAAEFTAIVSSSWLAWSLAELGELTEAAAAAADAVRLAGAGHHPFLLGHAYAATGYVEVRRGDPEAAIPWLERFREVERVGAVLRQFPLADWFLLTAYAHARRPESVPLLSDVTTGAIGERDIFYYPFFMGWLADAFHAMGRLGDARALAERAVSLAQRRGERGHAAWGLVILGELAADAGDADAEPAEGYFFEALGLAMTLGMRVLRVRCYLGLGRLYRARGLPAASEHLRAATELATQIGVKTPVE